MTGFLIHCGLPKTGTSVLQATLAGSAPLLASAGVLYPAAGRRGNAHHPLAIALREEGADVPAQCAAPLLAEVAAHPDGPPRLAVCSSEQFSNLFNPVRISRLTGFVTALGRPRVRTVVVLREYTSFIESMYLQRARFQDNRGSFDDFLNHVLSGVPNLLQALTVLRSDLGEGFEMVPAKPGFDVLPLFDGLLGLAPGTLTPAFAEPDATAKPSLKLQAVLSNLPWLKENLGFAICRKRLQRQVRDGHVVFADDVAGYTLYPPGRRQAVAQALVPLMRAQGFDGFADLSEPVAADAGPGHLPRFSIEPEVLTPGDLALLAAMRSKIKDKPPKPKARLRPGTRPAPRHP